MQGISQEDDLSANQIIDLWFNEHHFRKGENIILKNVNATYWYLNLKIISILGVVLIFLKSPNKFHAIHKV